MLGKDKDRQQILKYLILIYRYCFLGEQFFIYVYFGK